MEKANIPAFSADPQQGFQAIEDIATAYWFSEALFAAVEMGIFAFLEPPGKSAGQLSRACNADENALRRLLGALSALGLVCASPEDVYFNSALSSRYLAPGKEDYQGASVLWRKELRPGWAALKDRLAKGNSPDSNENGHGDESERENAGRIRKYIMAMDAAARVKIKEISPILGTLPLEGEMLDAGAGSGAVSAALIERAPSLRATLMDIPQVLAFTGEIIRERGLADKIDLCPANILDPWPFNSGRFSLIVLSNIIHAYSEAELPHILKEAAGCLAKDGLVLIHDFFPEHAPAKASLFDLNMLINTYNGRVFGYGEVKDGLVRAGFHTTGLIPLASDTALVAAAKDPAVLSKLHIAPAARLAARVRQLGFTRVVPVRTEDVQIPGWTGLRCRYGCGNFGKKPHCPPDAPTPEETKHLLQKYSKALLLEGEPPSGVFQANVLKAEREAFTAGFYKAFSYWAGPCALCKNCETPCRNPKDARPSMEGAGIDVFETVRRAGLELRTLSGRDDFVKYFALLLLE